MPMRCDRMLPPDGLIPVVWWERGSLVGGHLASALIGTCRADRHFNLFINASESLAERSWLLRCTIVTHEIGHLIGLDHDAPFAVMREADEIPECYKPGQAERRAKRLRSRAKRLERRARKLRSTRAKPARRARLRRRAAKHRRLARRLTGVARAGVAIHGGAWSL